MNTQTLPTVGTAIVPLPIDGLDWYGLPDPYHNKPGIITAVNENNVVAEFRSHQKPDDSESFTILRWRERATIGDRVRIASGPDNYVGQTGTVKIDDKSSLPYYIEFESLGSYWFTLEQVEKVYVETLTVTMTDERKVGAAEVTVPANPTMDELLAIIEVTSNDLAAAKRLAELRQNSYEAESNRSARYARDWTLAGSMLLEEAERRGWCSEFDEFVEAVNGRTEILEWEARDEEVDIEWEETYIVTVPRSGTATLKRGYDSSDVEEAARSLNSNDDASISEIVDAVRNGNYESDSYVDDSAQTA
jgi:hypothetical protein